MLIPSKKTATICYQASLSRRVNANSQQLSSRLATAIKLIKKGEC